MEIDTPVYQKDMKTFTFINNEKLCEIIASAKQHIIYAAPSVSAKVAQALCEFSEGGKDSTLRVIIDADAEAFRLGFGEQAGLTLLAQNRIDILCAPGLRIAVLIADKEAWGFIHLPPKSSSSNPTTLLTTRSM